MHHAQPHVAGCVVPGAGAVEMAASISLHQLKTKVPGRARLGVQAFADALLVVPKILASNSGFDAQETIVKLQVCLRGGKIGYDPLVYNA